jgi:hypothetical protein
VNRFQRRKNGVVEKTVSIKLDEWRASPDKLVTRGDVMAFMALHKVNDHKPGLLKKLLARFR